MPTLVPLLRQAGAGTHQPFNQLVRQRQPSRGPVAALPPAPPAEALRGNVEALARSTPGGMRPLCIKSQAWLVEVWGILGEFVEGIRHGEEAVRLAIVDGPWNAETISVHARLGCLYLA